MPVPMMNVLNGGKHADSSVDMQEFMIVPLGAPTFADAMRMGAEVFHALAGVLKKRGQSTNVGDEGGFAPNLRNNEEPIEVILEAIAKAGYQPGADVALALDPASSEFYDDGRYVFARSDKKARDSDQMVRLWSDWVDRYPIVSIEDGLAEDDWAGWQTAHTELGGARTTRRRRPLRDQSEAPGTRHPRAGGQLDPDQAQPDRHAQRNARRRSRWHAPPASPSSSRIVRARPRTRPSPTSPSRPSAGQIKTGSMSRGERTAKYNRLLRIAEELGARASWPGAAAFRRGGSVR